MARVLGSGIVWVTKPAVTSQLTWLFFYLLFHLGKVVTSMPPFFMCKMRITTTTTKKAYPIVLL